jgi:hypothetical protein
MTNKFMIGLGNENSLMYHRIAEAFKWAYGKRSKLGDPSDASITEEVNEVRIILWFLIWM